MEEKQIHEINDHTAPSLIEHFIGQERVKKLVKTALEASWMDGNRLPHMIFSGPPGVGKSQLASILAKETGVELIEQLAQNLSGITDVQGFLLQAKEKSVLLLDEIDQLGKLQQVTLYMEGIDSLGLTIDERKYLSIVNTHNNQLRLNVIATCFGMSSRSVSTNIEPYLICGFKIHPHLLRHSFSLQFLKDTNNDLVALAQILGHENLNTTKIYSQRSDSDLAEIAERLNY